MSFLDGTKDGNQGAQPGNYVNFEGVSAAQLALTTARVTQNEADIAVALAASTTLLADTQEREKTISVGTLEVGQTVPLAATWTDYTMRRELTPAVPWMTWGGTGVVSCSITSTGLYVICLHSALLTTNNASIAGYRCVVNLAGGGERRSTILNYSRTTATPRTDRETQDFAVYLQVADVPATITVGTLASGFTGAETNSTMVPPPLLIVTRMGV